MTNSLIVDHPLLLKYKLIHGEIKAWDGDIIEVENGFYSTAGCGFWPSGKVEYCYE